MCYVHSTLEVKYWNQINLYQIRENSRFILSLLAFRIAIAIASKYFASQVDF